MQSGYILSSRHQQIRRGASELRRNGLSWFDYQLEDMPNAIPADCLLGCLGRSDCLVLQGKQPAYRNQDMGRHRVGDTYLVPHTRRLPGGRRALLDHGPHHALADEEETGKHGAGADRGNRHGCSHLTACQHRRRPFHFFSFPTRYRNSMSSPIYVAIDTPDLTKAQDLARRVRGHVGGVETGARILLRTWPSRRAGNDEIRSADLS